MQTLDLRQFKNTNLQMFLQTLNEQEREVALKTWRVFEEYLEDLEDLELAKKAKAEYEASGRQGIAWSDLKKAMDS